MKKFKLLFIGALFVGAIIGSVSIKEVQAFVFGSIQQIPEWVRDSALIKLRTETNNVRVGSAGTFFVDTSGNKIGIASTTPWGLLSVNPNGIPARHL